MWNDPFSQTWSQLIIAVLSKSTDTYDLVQSPRTIIQGAEPSAGIASTGQEEDMEEEEERGDKEVTDLRAKVEEAEDRRRKAEEELKIQSDLRAELEEAQDSRVTAMEELKVVTDLRVEVHELENRRLTAKLEEVQNRKMSAELELKILWSRLSGWKVHVRSNCMWDLDLSL